MTIALMAAVLVSLGALALRTAVRSSTLEAAGLTHAVVTRELNRLLATPFASLPARAGCETSRSEFPHTRCVTVSELSPHVRRLTLVVSPIGGSAGADTVVIDRAATPRNPLRGP